MPQISDNTPYGDITIAGLPFQYPRPYEAGHTLTEGEASALNQVFGENLRNNYAQKIRGMLEEHKKANNIPEDEELSAGVLDKDTLDSEFAEYAAKYEFGVRQAGSGPRAPADPVGKEAHRIAWDRIKAALQKKGIQINTVTKEQKDNLIQQALTKYPDIRETAEQYVNAKASIAMEELQL